jgi:hypothetical protein
MTTTIKLKNGTGVPTAGALVQGEPAFDLTNKRLYTENAGGTVIEVGTNPSTIVISAGTINGTVIGGTTAAAISGTTGQFGTSLNVDGTVTADGLTVQTTNGLSAVLESANSYQHLQFKNSGYIENYIDFTNRDFNITCDNVNRFTINGTNGNVGIGTNSPSSYDFNDPAKLVVANTSGNSTLTIASGASNIGYLAFADGTTGTSRYSGSVQYNHSTNALSMHTTDGTERFRIASDGSISTPTLGTSNVRFGVNAGNSITSGGNYNTVVGDEAGTAITTGEENTFIGYTAGDATTTASGNTALGFSALTTNVLGSRSVAIGRAALQVQNPAIATNMYNVAVGHGAGESVTTGVQNTLIGGLAGDAQTTASNNTAVGYQALTATTTGGDNDAFGSEALRSLTTANLNVALGRNAMYSTTTGASNLAAGTNAMYSNTEGGSNVALGKDALRSNTTASNNTAVGHQAGYSNTTGTNFTALGQGAMYSNTTGNNSTAVGRSALYTNTTGASNSALGQGSLGLNSTGSNNSAFGADALNSNTTADNNTAVGSNSLVANTTGGNNTAIGRDAGLANTTGTDNTYLGTFAGEAATDGTSNTFVGRASGNVITTGSKNTILGRYNGNQGGLDIRTASNYIVLSDGDGNPRGVFDASGNLIVGGGVLNTVNAFSVHPATNPYIGLNKSLTGTHDAFYFQHNGSVIGKITYSDSATAYVTSSDYRLKENVTDITDGIDRLKQLPVHKFNFIVDPDTTVDGFLAHEVQDIVPEAITGTKDKVDAEGKPVYQGIDQSKLVPLLTAALKEAITRIETLEAEVAAIKGA